MKLVSLCLLIAGMLVPFTLGCGKAETGVVVEQDELSAYVAEHPSEDTNVATED